MWKEELKSLEKQKAELQNILLKEYELRRDEIRKEYAFVCGEGKRLEQCIKEVEEVI